jgi:methyl-accepting chemotaxis protein
MNISSVRIGPRLGGAFGIVILLMAALIGIGLMRFADVSVVNDRIIDKDWVKAEAANTINATTKANARRNMELLLAANEAEWAPLFQQIAANKKTIDDAFVILDRLVYTPKGKEVLGRLKEARGKYVASFGRVGKLVRDGQREQAAALMKSETLPLLDALQVPINDLTALQKQLVEASSAEIKQDIRTARSLMIALGLAAAAAAALLAYWITRSITVPLNDAVRIAQAVAGGDLTSVISVNSTDETGNLLQALKEMNASLVNIVSQVRGGTDMIATASSQIAGGNLDLSSRTEQQASSLEETASSMEELTSTVRQNADNAYQANSLSDAASKAASDGGSVVSQVVRTMGEINESSRQISDIISVIDGIAFQTNILALNAAVEAARAGEQGRGFAVVASEVRNLAQRSASAAKEIKQLITISVDRVSEGQRLVDRAGATMETVVASVQRVTDVITEISTASSEQSGGIEQINQAIMQMETVTQQNASLVEEAAAAAASLQDQAAALAHVVSAFKIDIGTKARAFGTRQVLLPAP